MGVVAHTCARQQHGSRADAGTVANVNRPHVQGVSLQPVA